LTADVSVEIRPVDDLSALAATWRDLESRADGSFFQSWAWTGCLAEERFDEPWLMTAHRGDRPVALALLNRGPRRRLRRPRSLLLAESGDSRRDSIFIEHNGPLIDRDEPQGLARRCWEALADAAESGLRRATWVLSGVPHAMLAELPAARRERILARRPAPYLTFAKLASGASALDAMSPNTRQQLRRSLRSWEAIGTPRLEVAQNGDEADVFLSELKSLHQRYWIGRGKPGAFAEPFFERFHRALIRRAGPSQQLDLIRFSAGGRIMGYLYNLVHRGWVAAYQSGFDFGADSDRLRPGLVCHLLAIEHYRKAGARLYDFLGGEARYKRSLANDETELVWLEARPRLLPRLATGRG
jgi:CelD/BcsL family acetyltransferase involved in cellulose biosynthesis